jgi:hypothetical protein
MIYIHTARLLFLCGLCEFALTGCSPQPVRPAAGTQPPPGTGKSPTARPPALINDQPVPWEALQPVLAEAAGAAALEEVILDRLLAAEYQAALNKDPGTIPNEQLAVERDYLSDTIRRSGANPEQAATLIADLRKARGLGHARFTALLRRNALMREIVAPQAIVTPEMISQRYEIRFGPRFRVRILTTSSEAECAAALRQLAGSQDLGLRFAELASRISTDESATRGGQIEPISPADPAYSPALRAALADLKPGQLSPVVALDPGFAIALLEERLPPTDTTLQAEAPDIENELRRRQERLLMDALARRLLQSARVIVLDPSLGWSWQNRRTEPGP